LRDLDRKPNQDGLCSVLTATTPMPADLPDSRGISSSLSMERRFFVV